MTIFEKIWNNRRALRSIISTIYFNFHYLPFSQAVKLPILLYKPKLKEMKGSIKINGKLKFGMIKLGFPTVSLYPNSGIMYENHGGKILFWGQCAIGNNSAISIGSKGQVEIGDRCSAFTTFRLVSYDKVNIGEEQALDGIASSWTPTFTNSQNFQADITVAMLPSASALTIGSAMAAKS